MAQIDIVKRKSGVLSVEASGHMHQVELSVIKDGKQIKLNDEFTINNEKCLVVEVDSYSYDDPRITLVKIAEKIEETKPVNGWFERPMSSLI